MRLRPVAIAWTALLAMFAVSVVAPRPAEAQAWLQWGDCPGSYLGDVRSFACDTNDRVHRISIGMTATQNMDDVTSFVAYVKFGVFDPGPLPDWWRVDAAGCRPEALTASIDVQDPPYEDLCQSVWQPGDTLEHTVFYGSPNGYAIVLVEFIVKPVHPVSLVAGRSYVLGELRLASTGTTGASSCAGCSTPAAIWIPDGLYFQDASTQWTTVPSSAAISWQDRPYSFNPASDPARGAADSSGVATHPKDQPDH